jgi:hypothetical protein
MRHTLAPVILLALFVACGGNGGDEGFPEGGGGGPTPVGDSGTPGQDGYSPGQDQYTPPSDSGGGGTDGTTPPSDTGASCTSLKCTSDTECQSACGPVSGGIECCDTATQVCFPTSATACPVSTPPSDGGGMY